MNIRKWLGWIVAGTLATASAQANGEDYVKYGQAKFSSGDFDGAIADYDQAIAGNSQDINAYAERGLARNAKGDLKGAIDDFSQVIALDPKRARGYDSRGMIEKNLDEMDAAMADFNQALALSPKNARFHYHQGLVLEDTGDLDRAIREFNRTIALDSNATWLYENRAFAQMANGNLDAAIADLNQSISLDAEQADYAHFYLWLIQVRKSGEASADAALSSYMGIRRTRVPDWGSKVGAFLLGQMNEADFLSAAASPVFKSDQGQHCEAWYYAGIKHLFAHEDSIAAEDFQKCLATHQFNYTEYWLAYGEIKRLKARPSHA